MSSLVVMLPRGHRVKVATNPNMALLAIKVIILFSLQLVWFQSTVFSLLMITFQDTACTKKGLDPQMFTLEYKGKRVDLSSTVRWTNIANPTYQYDQGRWFFRNMSNSKVRFSGIPNNGTLELVELSQDEVGKEEKVIKIQGSVVYEKVQLVGNQQKTEPFTRWLFVCSFLRVSAWWTHSLQPPHWCRFLIGETLIPGSLEYKGYKSDKIYGMI